MVERNRIVPKYNLGNTRVKERLGIMGLRFSVLALAAVIPLLAFADDVNDELLAASRKGDLAEIKVLLGKGAAVDAKSPYGQTPLFFAADRGHTEVVKFLLEKGANPNVSDTFYHATALIWAASKGRTEIVKMLLAKGAEGVDDVLMAGVQNGNKELLQVALGTGKVKPRTMTFALAAATKAKKGDIVEMLKQAGATPAAPATFKVDEATLASYAGKYQGGRGGTEFDFNIGVVDGKLALTSPQKLTFAAVSATQFRGVEFDQVEIEFVTKDGKVTGAAFTQPGGTLDLKRVN